MGRKPTNLILEFSQEEIEKLNKPISPAHGFSVAYWFLTQCGTPERARAFLEIAIVAMEKLAALTPARSHAVSSTETK